MQQQIGGGESRAARPGTAFKHVLEDRRVGFAEAHAQAFHRQVAFGGTLYFLEVMRGVELFQFRDGRAARRGFEMFFIAEQTKRLKAQPGAAGALGLERAIRRVAQRFGFR